MFNLMTHYMTFIEKINCLFLHHQLDYSMVHLFRSTSFDSMPSEVPMNENALLSMKKNRRFGE